jgi:MoaA/NifB/PqqE/SkfB family radical SAM enzyme
MPWDVFVRSLEIAKNNQIPALNFFGGEPLLNPQVFPMIQLTLENNLSLVLSTNCRPFEKEDFFTQFMEITRESKKNLMIVTARDRFHLRFFDPKQVINRLQEENYEVQVNEYSNHNVLLSEHNAHVQELNKIDTCFSCCGGSWTDHVGVLPDGGWTICPPSLECFGNIFTQSLEEIINFKRRLPLRYKEGCTACLKDFGDFQREFKASKIT